MVADATWDLAELDALAASTRIENERLTDQGRARVAGFFAKPRVSRFPQKHSGTARRSVPVVRGQVMVAGLPASAPVIKPVPVVYPPSEAAASYAHSLLAQRDHHLSDDVIATALADRVGTSMLIDQLKTLPYRPRPVVVASAAPDLPEVAEGRYAVDNEQGVLAFYQVDRPQDGKWAGYTFLSVFASDERWPIKSFAAKRAILAKIAADPEAGPRYGQQIGRCYRCGRTLTDETSRSLGIGPWCRVGGNDGDAL